MHFFTIPLNLRELHSREENLIDKISVIPKRKSQQLFSGTIYIIEDLWCLHSVDLTNENLAGESENTTAVCPCTGEYMAPGKSQLYY